LSWRLRRATIGAWFSSLSVAIRARPGRVPNSGAALNGKRRSVSVPSSSAPQAHTPSRTDRVALDRLLELVGRRRLSAAELRILLQLVEREAGIPELAEALDQRPVDIRRCGRRLSARGLVSWRHAGPLKRTHLAITPAGMETVRALLTAAGGVVDVVARRT
jgi:DNA-binding MarR family transcriptional regulator